VRTEFEAPVFLHQNTLTGEAFGEMPETGCFVCRIPRLPLPTSTYRLGFAISTQAGGGTRLDAIANAVELAVEGGDFFGTGALPPIHSGVCLVEGAWRLEPAAASPAANLAGHV
jgi:hypothetical protein